MLSKLAFALLSTTVARALTADVALSNSLFTNSDGDLWPSCWSDDDNLYAANGDGKAFSDVPYDVAVSRIAGSPPDLSGTFLAGGDALGQVWLGSNYTRKPTGMLCRNSDIYLAVQDLKLDFNSAPAATIAVSHDHGATWDWDRSAPMFDNLEFTTLFFLDYGKDSALAPADWVYVYGLDNNWRGSFDGSVPSPTELFLARVPPGQVQNRSSFEWYTNLDGDKPCWTSEIGDKSPVLVDERKLYPCDPSQGPGTTVGVCNLTVISQGGVTYFPTFDKYIYTSWTEFTYEFYEAANPWGPWSLFYEHDFGKYPWTNSSYGGYGTTIPSKYVSENDTKMLLQSNVCPCANAGVVEYSFNLREMSLSQ